MPPLGPATGLAMAAGEASLDEDVCAQLTAPSNSKSGRTRIVSRMMKLPLYSKYYSLVISAMPRRQLLPALEMPRRPRHKADRSVKGEIVSACVEAGSRHQDFSGVPALRCS